MKNKKMNKGITLVALVVTIVILIILATISINAVLGENGLIKRAEKAAEYQANAEKSESDAIDELLHQAGVATGEIIENPYDKDAWKYAWVCENGTWDNTKYEAGAEIPEGEGIVVAKIYETGNKITPPDLNMDGTIYTFTEGNDYVMVIEGQGEMGQLMETSGGNITAGYGWQYESVLFMAGYAETCTLPYVSEAIICDGVTNIGLYALGGDTSLKKVTISRNVTSIGDFAFAMCSSLTSVTIPDNVTSIGESAFDRCSSLTNITIPESVTKIGDTAFVGCSSLTNVIIPDSVTSIGDHAFDFCSSLTNVIIGNSVTSIGEFAFYGCNRLTNVTIPDSVISIEARAFGGCYNLSAIKIYQNNLDSITFGYNCFGGEGTASLGAIYNYIAENSVIYVLSEDMKTKLDNSNSAYYSGRTTVQVVTLDEMNAI